MTNDEKYKLIHRLKRLVEANEIKQRQYQEFKFGRWLYYKRSVRDGILVATDASVRNNF